MLPLTHGASKVYKDVEILVASKLLRLSKQLRCELLLSDESNEGKLIALERRDRKKKASRISREDVYVDLLL